MSFHVDTSKGTQIDPNLVEDYVIGRRSWWWYAGFARIPIGMCSLSKEFRDQLSTWLPGGKIKASDIIINKSGSLSVNMRTELQRRTNPPNASNAGSRRMHNGIDIPCTTADQFLAPWGTKNRDLGAPKDPSKPEGYVIAVNKEGGRLDIQYDNGIGFRCEHLSKILVKVGDPLYAGQVLAHAGMKGMGGHSYFKPNVHLHLETWFKDPKAKDSVPGPDFRSGNPSVKLGQVFPPQQLIDFSSLRCVNTKRNDDWQYPKSEFKTETPETRALLESARTGATSGAGL